VRGSLDEPGRQACRTPHFAQAFINAALDAGVLLRDVQEAPATPTRAPRFATTDDANRWIATPHHRGHIRRGRLALTPESGVQADSPPLRL
jgi:hypothetical protein